MTLVFIASPILATLNHFTVNGKTVGRHKHPGKLMHYWSLLAITSLTLLSIVFLRQTTSLIASLSKRLTVKRFVALENSILLECV